MEVKLFTTESMLNALHATDDRGFRAFRRKLAKGLSLYYPKRKYVEADAVQNIRVEESYRTFSVRNVLLQPFSSSCEDHVVIHCEMIFGKQDDREVVHGSKIENGLEFKPAEDITNIFFEALKVSMDIVNKLTLEVHVWTASVSEDNTPYDERSYVVISTLTQTEVTIVYRDYTGASSV